ncbi:MAG: hypothetical protein ACREFC_05010, partial [Stellaceae bacterium]
MTRPTRRGAIARRAAAFLPVVGLGGMVALIMSGSLPSPEHPRASQKRPVLQGKIAAAPHHPPARERHRDKNPQAAAHKSAPSLQPVAQATAPGVATDGSLHIAASLLGAAAAS